MRILLDESLPIELAFELSGHDVIPVQKMGWAGLKNGELLVRAADRFDILLTADQNLPYQQNLNNLPIAVIVITARSNRIEALRPHISELLATLASIQPCTLVHVGVQPMV